MLTTLLQWQLGAITKEHSSSELRVIGTNAHRVDSYFLHLTMHTLPNPSIQSSQPLVQRILSSNDCSFDYPPNVHIVETLVVFLFLDESTVSFGRLPRMLLRICDFMLMSPVLFQHLERRGIPTYAWVLNSETEYQRALDHGVTGIMTDYPTKLKQFLEQNNLLQWWQLMYT